MIKKHSPSLIIFIIALLIILIPIWHSGESWKSSIISSRFRIPKAPEITLSNDTQSQEITKKVNAYVFDIANADGDKTLVTTLQKAGWPAYLEQNKLRVGPFLDQNQKSDFQKQLVQLTQKNVTINSFDLNG